jgi:hypothetical protein
MVHRVLLVGGLAAGLMVVPGPIRAENGGPPSPAPQVPQVILNLSNQAGTLESRDRAFTESVKRDALAPRPTALDDWEAQPDGSMRNKRSGVSIVLRNPCPPGDFEHELALAAYNRAMASKPRR